MAPGETKRTTKEHYLGCLLGGAVGDALGAAIEFDKLSQIRRKFGPEGLKDYAPAYGREGAITDDTQMTLFTAEAMIRSHNRFLDRGICSPVDVARLAYLRWLKTQGEEPVDESYQAGWLIQQRGLFTRRAPGNSCLSALRSGGRGRASDPINDSKGCGGVMRMAPVGLSRADDPLRCGRKFAALTHGHPTGYIAAGFFAHLIRDLTEGLELSAALDTSISMVNGWYRKYPETVTAVRAAIDLAQKFPSGNPTHVAKLGQGWVAEEALAIGIYCALTAKTFSDGVLLAVNHSGDSDSTGSITGNILGLVYGVEGIPETWVERLELRDVITEVATDLWLHFGDGDKPAWADFESEGQPPDWERYPGN